VAGRFHFFTYIHIIIIACYNQKLRNKLKNRKAFLFKSLNQSVQPKYDHKINYDKTIAAKQSVAQAANQAQAYFLKLIQQFHFDMKHFYFDMMHISDMLTHNLRN